MNGIQSLLKYQRQAPIYETPIVSQLGAAGIHGDDMMGHLTKGEMILPKEMQTPGIMAVLSKHMRSQGMNPEQFRAGSPQAQRNPRTGAQMFAMWDSSGGYTDNRGNYHDAGDISWEGGNSGSSSSQNKMLQTSRSILAAKANPQSNSSSTIGTNSGALTLADVSLFGGIPPQRPPNRVSVDAGNAGAMQYYDPGWFSALGFNYGSAPHYQANSMGGIDSAWRDQAAWSPSRAAGDVLGMALGPIGSIGNAVLDWAGVYPNDFRAVDIDGIGSLFDTQGGEDLTPKTSGSNNDRAQKIKGIRDAIVQSSVGAGTPTTGGSGGVPTSSGGGAPPLTSTVVEQSAAGQLAQVDPNLQIDWENYAYGPERLMYPYRYTPAEIKPWYSGPSQNGQVTVRGQYYWPTIGAPGFSAAALGAASAKGKK